MKVLRFGFTGGLLLGSYLALACDVCQKQQPQLLRGVAHGAGPQNEWDYVIVGGTVLVALISLCYAVRWIVSPGETARNHIKRRILDLDKL